MFWKLLLFTVLVLIIAFAAIGIKILIKKGGKFERHCCHSDNSEGCICGGKGGEYCKRSNSDIDQEND